jgi:hypothetical protein
MFHKYRYVATAALAVVLAAGAAACGTDSEPQLRSEGASVQQNAQYLEQAGGDAAWAARIAQADNPEAVEAAARAARVARVAGSDRHLDMAAAEAARAARVAQAAGSDRHLDSLASEAAQIEARVAHAAGSDRHLQNLANELEGAASVIRMPIFRS